MDNNQSKLFMRIGNKLNFNKNSVIYICVFLACLVPRYIATFKVHLFLNFSYYALFVLAISFFFIKRIRISTKIEVSYFWIWLLFIVLSVWRAENISLWGYYVYYIVIALLFQQVLQSSYDEETYDYVVKGLTDALFLHLLMGIYEITTHRYLFGTGNVIRRLYGHVAIGMFHNLNDYATFVTTMIPFCLYRFIASKKPIEKLYSLFLTVTSFYLVIISESRGVIYTLIVFLFVGLFLFARKSKRNRLIVICVLVLSGTLLLTNVGGIRSSLYLLLNNNALNLSTNNDIARMNLIKNGLYFLKQTYGFGVGAGNLNTWLATKSIYRVGDLSYMHNWYVEVLSTFGVLFFIIYVYFHTKVAYKLGSSKYGKNPLKHCIFLSFVCFSIVSVSSSSNIYSEWVWMYFVLVSNYAYMGVKPSNQMIE